MAWSWKSIIISTAAEITEVKYKQGMVCITLQHGDGLFPCVFDNQFAVNIETEWKGWILCVYFIRYIFIAFLFFHLIF